MKPTDGTPTAPSFGTHDRPTAAPRGPGRPRARRATPEEIRAVARRLLVADGAGAITLRSIARELGMTAPALYRYVTSKDDLITGMIADWMHELVDAVEQARDSRPAAAPLERLEAAARAFRGWSVAHPGEFGLIFGPAVPGYHPPVGGPNVAAGQRFAEVFLELLSGAVAPRPAESPSAQGYADVLRDLGLPGADTLEPEIIQRVVSGWVHLFGVVSMEVFGHLAQLAPDPGQIFDAELAALVESLQRA